jgi:ribonuclease-3
MTTKKTSTLKAGLSVIGKLLTGTRKGPTGERVRRLKKLEKQIGVNFTDLLLLEQALTHRSYSHVTSQTRNDSNERMEFLGDSVLGLAVSQFLYFRFPERSEGMLSKMKSLLVSRKVLSSVARDLGLGEFILLSGEESEMGGRDRTSILADSFEGVIGAVYLDQGYRAANKFIQRFLLGNISEILKDEEHTNYKSLLQEHVQSRRLSHPLYRVRREEGPEHEKEFAVDVVVRGEVWGSGRGKSKKDAEQLAARAALESRQGRTSSRREPPASGRPEPSGEAPSPRGGRGFRRPAPREAADAGAAPGRKNRGGHGISASREKIREQRQQQDAEKRNRSLRKGRPPRTRREGAPLEGGALESMEAQARLPEKKGGGEGPRRPALGGGEASHWSRHRREPRGGSRSKRPSEANGQESRGRPPEHSEREELPPIPRMSDLPEEGGPPPRSVSVEMDLDVPVPGPEEVGPKELTQEPGAPAAAGPPVAEGVGFARRRRRTTRGPQRK